MLDWVPLQNLKGRIMKTEYTEIVIVSPEELYYRRMQARLGCKGCRYSNPDREGLMPCCSYATQTGKRIEVTDAGACTQREEGQYNYNAVDAARLSDVLSPKVDESGKLFEN